MEAVLGSALTAAIITEPSKGRALSGIESCHEQTVGHVQADSLL